MMRIRLTALLMLFGVLVLSVAGVVQAQDDGGVTIGVRDILRSGKGIQDTFEEGATAYVYAFGGSAGDHVTVSMTQNADSDLDPFVVLLGPKGEMLASDDDSGPDVVFSALISDLELPDNGTYLVLATTFAHIDEILVETGDATAEPTDQSFDLTVTGNTPAADLSADESALDIIPIAPGDTFDDVSSTNNPVDYYTLTGKAGDVITITATSDEFDTILHVFSPEGNRIAVNDDDPDGTSTNSAVRSFTLPEDGTYLIFATDVFFYNAGKPDESLSYTGGAYTISVE